MPDAAALVPDPAAPGTAAAPAPGSGSVQPGGRIIVISSTLGLEAAPYKAAYVAAKHAVIGLMKVAALEGATSGLTANAVLPG